MKDAVVNHNIDLTKWNIDKPLDDVVWTLMIDEPDSDEIKLDSGIFLPTQAKLRGFFRLGKALKIGPNVKLIKEGDFLLIPPNRGLLGHKSSNGYKTLFIKENEVLSTVAFDGTKEEFLAHQAKDLFAQVS
jgi:hypothetical protein